jgi:hypothetical protein
VTSIGGIAVDDVFGGVADFIPAFAVACGVRISYSRAADIAWVQCEIFILT